MGGGGLLGTNISLYNPCSIPGTGKFPEDSEGWTIPVKRWSPGERPEAHSMVSQNGSLVTGVDNSSKNLVALTLLQ